MRNRHTMLRGALLLAAASLGASVSLPGTVPNSDSGAFVQKKILRDVDVTLVSCGTFSFEKGREFVWKVEKPAPSVFVATPTNYSFTAAGRTTVRKLEIDVDSIEKIFLVKEVKEFVKDIRVTGSPLPVRVEVEYRNGDKLDIALERP